MNAIERMQQILDTGRWPSGQEVLPYERPVLAKNLAAIKEQEGGEPNRRAVLSYYPEGEDEPRYPSPLNTDLAGDET